MRHSSSSRVAPAPLTLSTLLTLLPLCEKQRTKNVCEFTQLIKLKLWRANAAL